MDSILTSQMEFSINIIIIITELLIIVIIKLLPVTTCGILETPRFGRKSNFFFVPGTRVTFECNQDFVLIGDQRRTCTPGGRWDIPEYGYTECLRKYFLIKYNLRLSFSCFLIIIN